MKGANSIVIVLTVMLLMMPWNARGQTSSSSRPSSATVIGTYVARNGELTLLVLWRGSPGWYSGGSGNSTSGGGGASAGREVGSFSLTYGSRSFSIDFDYTARVARLLQQEISLADTNVVFVDDVDGPSGPRIVGRHWVDPKLAEAAGADQRTVENDPATIGIRRAPQIWAFLQCDVPLPVPSRADADAVDPEVLRRVTEYMQGVLTRTCRATTRP